MNNTMLPCPTPWCNATKVHTTTFFKSRDVKGSDIRETFTEIEHSCPSCHVRTPQMDAANAHAVWNTRAEISEGEAKT